MNLSHNKFSEKSGENLGLGISELQLMLLYKYDRIIKTTVLMKCASRFSHTLILRVQKAWKSLQVLTKNNIQRRWVLKRK